MYFWHNHELALELRKGIEEFTTFKYLSFNLVLYYLVFELLSEKGHYNSLFNPFSGILGLIVLSFGLYYSFKANQNGDNKDFVTRFVCLSVPITLKSFMLASLLVVVPVLLLAKSQSAYNIYFFSLLFSLIFQLAFFFMMIKSIKIASEYKEKKTPKKTRKKK